MDIIKYVGTVSPYKDDLTGSGLTWTLNQEATVSDDVGHAARGYPGLFQLVDELPSPGVKDDGSLVGENGAPVSGGGAVRAPRMGIVATKARVHDTNNFGSAIQWMSRRNYVALDAVTAVSIRFDNWSTGSASETSGAQAQTVTATLEYPIGTIHSRFTFSGGNTGTVPAGGALVSDSLAVTLPLGARFAVRSWLNAPGGAAYTQVLGASGDGSSFGASIADTTGTTAALPANVTSWGPTAVLGMTSRPVVAIAGDSIGAGYLDSAGDNLAGAVGVIGRSIYLDVPTLNVSSVGNTLPGFAGVGTGGLDGRKKRQYMVDAGCTHVISNLGVNDAGGSRASSQMITDLNALIALIGLPWIHCTITPPQAASTDAYLTVANQTAHANAVAQQQFNDALRRGTAGLLHAAHVEIADLAESSRGSGKWRVDGVTANLSTPDGLHPSVWLYRQIAQVNPFRSVLSLIR